MVYKNNVVVAARLYPLPVDIFNMCYDTVPHGWVVRSSLRESQHLGASSARWILMGVLLLGQVRSGQGSGGGPSTDACQHII